MGVCTSSANKPKNNNINDVSHPQKPSHPKKSKPSNGLIEDIQYNKIKEETDEYKTLNDKYIKTISDINTYAAYTSIEGLSNRSTFASHKNDKSFPMNQNFKKIMKEIRKQLPQNIITSINGSMFIRFDEDNPRFIQALLTGIDDTPYESGLFLFDIYLSNDYPTKAPMIKHITKGATLCHANNGPGGFSPNLHQTSGKVCLSLLGTWDGPSWEPNKSNVYQILSTIMLMVFGAKHPYYMEPSYGGWEGTVVGRTQHEREVIDYDEEVMYHTAKYAILETMKTPYIGYEDVIKMHFLIKSECIENTIERWINNKNYTNRFRGKMKSVLKDIKCEFEKLRKEVNI